MVTVVASVDLPVDEKLTVKKNTIKGEGSDKRFCLLTGIHGDELEGQLVCYKVQERINADPQNFHGTLDIYPALNPLGIDSITRGIPAFDLDMNRTFPGEADGTMTEYIASKILEDASGADFALDVHASSIFIRELPQVRIPPEFKDKIIDKAKLLNMDLLWIHNNGSVQENSLVYTLNQNGTPAAVIDMGIGMRYTSEFADQLTDGIFCLLAQMEMWTGSTIKPREPVYSDQAGDMTALVSKMAGFFVRKVDCGQRVQKGDLLGEIISPLEGKLLAQIKAPCAGLLFTLREYPIVEIGSTLGRLLNEGN
ncbi:MAG: succinylglutamate desuccinylase/aspartoacylase family protein [Treponema sp.]|nr:succinylglutamate desuccinylase/aspartoacylase family protein [Treponema sp.]